MQFVADLHSGKLHREFHNGPDPTTAAVILVLTHFMFCLFYSLYSCSTPFRHSLLRPRVRSITCQSWPTTMATQWNSPRRPSLYLSSWRRRASATRSKTKASSRRTWTSRSSFRCCYLRFVIRLIICYNYYYYYYYYYILYASPQYSWVERVWELVRWDEKRWMEVIEGWESCWIERLACL